MILSRIKEFIDAKGISIAAFEKSIGAANASFSKPLKTGGNIGSDKLENILIKYPDLNPIWLMTGRGEMLINADSFNNNVDVNVDANVDVTQKSQDNPQCLIMVKEPSVQYESAPSHYIRKESEEESKQPHLDNSNELIKHLIKQLNEKSEEIGALRQENSTLKRRLAQLAETVRNAKDVPA